MSEIIQIVDVLINLSTKIRQLEIEITKLQRLVKPEFLTEDDISDLSTKNLIDLDSGVYESSEKDYDIKSISD
jgi:hypothetical protein